MIGTWRRARQLRRRTGSGRAVALLLITGGLAATGCGPATEPEVSEAEVVIDDPAELDEFHLDLGVIDSTAWVRAYDPERSVSGYNLLLYRRRVPVIVDMNGRMVHAWPLVRAVGRARLDDMGRLLVIGIDNRIKEYDWEGRLLWHYDMPDEQHLPHHDVLRLANGHVLVLVNDRSTRADVLLEVDREGGVAWQWRFVDHADAFPGWEADSADRTHSNSIHELPPNPWFEQGDERFRPGNILVSARNLSTVFIIDRRSGEVTWSYTGELDFQHEASMLGADQPDAGRILLFNNGLENRHAFRRSRIEIIDPVRGELSWQYASKHFFSSVGGTVQALPGGNLAVTSSRGGRIFELTRHREIVWEWVPPYFPIRTERLAYDHCPQLAALERPREVPVSAPPEMPYIDHELYQLAIEREVRGEEVAGATRDVVPEDIECRPLQVPPGAVMRAGFGIRPPRDGVDAVAEGRFRLDVRERGRRRSLADLVLASSRDGWNRVRDISLDDYAYQTVNLCIGASVLKGGDSARGRLVWGNPVVDSAVLRPLGELPSARVTERERQLRLRQLEALGYVD